MKIISLKHFAETGKFGEIGIGNLKNDVIEEFGNDFDYYDGGETQIIKYGWYEFFFWSDTKKLFGIQNDHLQADCGNHDEMILFENQKFKVDTWFLEVNKDFTFKEVTEILNNNKTKFKLEVPYKNEPEIIKFNSNVYFDFSSGFSSWDGKKDEWCEIKINNKEDYILNGIRFFDFNKL
ncbi:hypothetical protein [Kordia sp.]|uniref:hypothetical protein n=1 Tax=Kordia sp. TaxID=1965332 RepID=UPI0025C73345|nr:hypothetical protein [Kordia sp.]MCH2193139.1 hypothetical protein [Kordia sp.]